MLEKAQVWIYSKTPTELREFRVLVMKLLPERGGFWQPVTGHVEVGESIEVGAFREAFEETGFKPKNQGPAVVALDYEFTFQGKWGVAHETAFAMQVADGCPEPILDPNEHTAFQWVSPRLALEIVPHESNRLALEKLIQALSRE